MFVIEGVLEHMLLFVCAHIYEFGHVPFSSLGVPGGRVTPHHTDPGIWHPKEEQALLEHISPGMRVQGAVVADRKPPLSVVVLFLDEVCTRLLGGQSRVAKRVTA